MTDTTERESSSLDIDAGPGSEGETDPGSEGDFTGEPMQGVGRDAELSSGTEGGIGTGSDDADATAGPSGAGAAAGDRPEPPQPGG